MLLGVGYVSAAYRSVVVHRHDGTSVAIGLDADLAASIADGALVFSSSKGLVSLSAEEVHYWSFSTENPDQNIWTGLETAAVRTVTVTCDGGNIALSNLNAGSRVALVAINGQTVAEAVADASGVCTLTASDFRNGVYILHYDNHSIKLILGR